MTLTKLLYQFVNKIHFSYRDVLAMPFYDVHYTLEIYNKEVEEQNKKQEEENKKMEEQQNEMKHQFDMSKNSYKQPDIKMPPMPTLPKF